MFSLDPATISGNASDDIKRFLADPQTSFNTLIEGMCKTTFAESVVNRIVISEVSVAQNATEPSRHEARVVCRIQVADDMVNRLGSLHGGCSSLLVDLCSTTAMVALQMHLSGLPTITVSQAMHLIFHAPAALGEDLQIINTSISVGKRVESAKTEIWSTTRRRLLVTGIHVKMAPTRKPKPAFPDAKL